LILKASGGQYRALAYDHVEARETWPLSPHANAQSVSWDNSGGEACFEMGEPGGI
jgi:hypothetical protein